MSITTTGIFPLNELPEGVTLPPTVPPEGPYSYAQGVCDGCGEKAQTLVWHPSSAVLSHDDLELLAADTWHRLSRSHRCQGGAA